MSLTYFFVKTFFRLLSIAMQWPILLSTKPATSGSSIIGKFVAKMDSTTRYSTWHELIMINKSGVVWKILWVSPWDSKVLKSSVSLNRIYHIVWKSQKSLIFECLKLAVKQNYQTGQFKSNENWWKIEENRIRYFGWFSNNVYQKLLFLWNFFIADGPTFLYHPRTTSGDRLETITLYCIVDSNPQPQYYWTKDSSLEVLTIFSLHPFISRFFRNLFLLTYFFSTALLWGYSGTNRVTAFTFLRVNFLLLLKSVHAFLGWDNYLEVVFF